MHWQRWFFLSQLGIRWDSSSLPQSAAEHVLVSAVQMRPVVSALQSLSPQAQAALLGAEPSGVAQVENWLHLFWDRSQCMPVVPAVSQSTLPHAQADGFAAEPSVVAHGAGREQVLDAAVQTMPVPCPSSLLVHTAFPQMQGAALLGADPSVFVQAGAVRVHMHVSSVEQDVVEEVSRLKYRVP